MSLVEKLYCKGNIQGIGCDTIPTGEGIDTMEKAIAFFFKKDPSKVTCKLRFEEDGQTVEIYATDEAYVRVEQAVKEDSIVPPSDEIDIAVIVWWFNQKYEEWMPTMYAGPNGGQFVKRIIDEVLTDAAYDNYREVWTHCPGYSPN